MNPTFSLTITLAICLGCAHAAPSVDTETARICIREGYNANLGKQVRRDRPDARSFYLQDISSSDLSCFCKEFPETTELEIYSHKLTDLSPLVKLNKLQKLIVFATALEEPASIAPLTGLQHLSFTCTPLGNDLNWLATLTGLRTLHIAAMSEKDKIDARIIAQLPNLEELSLGPCTLTHAEAMTGCKALTTVSISGNAGLKSLSPFKRLPKLKLILLEEGAFSTAELTGFPDGIDVSVMESEPSY